MSTRNTKGVAPGSVRGDAAWIDTENGDLGKGGAGGEAPFA